MEKVADFFSSKGAAWEKGVTDIDMPSRPMTTPRSRGFILGLLFVLTGAGLYWYSNVLNANGAYGLDTQTMLIKWRETFIWTTMRVGSLVSGSLGGYLFYRLGRKVFKG